MRLIPLLIFVIVALASVAPGSVLAQSSAIEVLEAGAEPDFPNAITFNVEAQSESPIVEVELFWHASKSPSLNLVRPDFEQNSRVSIRHTIDMLVNYLPPGTDISYWWRLVNESGQVLRTDVETFLYIDGRYGWKTESEGLTTVWWYSGGDEFGEEILSAANATSWL